MTVQQLALSFVLAIMVFSVALELKIDDFRRVAKTPLATMCGLIPQFVLLPGATWVLTMLFDLGAPVEAAMILVACCPGGSLSNVITHMGRGNTALSVSISAVASMLALFLTPFNFSIAIAANPQTASWLRTLSLDPSGIWWSLLALLALPMSLGLLFSHRLPAAADRLKKPLGNFSLVALLAFIAVGLVVQRAQLNVQLLPKLGLVIGHNALGLLLGYLCALAFRVTVADRRAIMIEGGMQNSGLALGIIALQFNADVDMVVIASLWGIWHIVSGVSLAFVWRRHDARLAH